MPSRLKFLANLRMALPALSKNLGRMYTLLNYVYETVLFSPLYTRYI
jgi:hypothetical protein